MVKLNFINKKVCLINWNHETYTIEQQFITSLWKPYEMFHFSPLNSVLFFLNEILFSIHFLDSILMFSLNFSYPKTL